MLNKLPPRERQIVELLYQGGDMAVADICDALPDRLSGSAVRAMLKRLEDKGFVRRRTVEESLHDIAQCVLAGERVRLGRRVKIAAF